MVIVNLYQERQLRSASDWRNLKLRCEMLLFAAHLDEQLLDFFKNQFFLSLRAEKLVLVFLTKLRHCHAKGRILYHLDVHDLSNLRLVQIQKKQELLRQEALLLLITARAIPAVVSRIRIFLLRHRFLKGNITFLGAELNLRLLIVHASLLFFDVGRSR